MLNDLAADAQVYLVTGYTDLRRGIDGLATIVQAQLRLDPFSKALFLFCGRRCDRIKGLLWEGLSEYSDKKATGFFCCTSA
ncbi:IS66 family insertion sequence element accessory protein TnpB [uncultured Ruminococcus sp.]|uniref:IS66 family insertion sequence element accessory protein TnpB n=1 Tax=uncultured Ruminococcus sp. TaxID=165186 RepID=UPI0025E0180B|nr:IS66 family insertion sequence element accessory protein TnpB [uncultured Ruminococcus sp.]